MKLDNYSGFVLFTKKEKRTMMDAWKELGQSWFYIARSQWLNHGANSHHSLELNLDVESVQNV